MLSSVRYEKGHGNSSIFARARNQSSQFYNFVTTTWVSSESANTKVFLTEYADGDPIDSLYAADVAFPVIESIQEVVDSTGLVIGSGVYAPGASGALSLAEIEASTVLMKSSDARLDNLDAPISLTSTYAQVDDFLIPLLDALVGIQSNTGVTNADIGNIADALMGNWEIVGTQMIFYKRDGLELVRFNLTDKFGNASDHAVFKRTKV